MSDLISEKVKEARLLLKEADAEETEGTKLEDQIKALQARSEALLKSAREKRAIGTAQLEVVEALSKGAPVVVAAAPAETKKRGGRQKAATIAVVPVAEPTPKGKGKAKAPKAPKAAKATAAPAPDPAPTAAKPTKAKGAAKPKKAAAATATPAPDASIVRVPAERNGLPPLRDRLQTVIGTDEVTIADAITRLKAHDKSWVPKSDDLSAYISLVLSTHAKKGDVFERVKRGIYRVSKSAPALAVKPSSAPKKLAKTNGSNGHVNGASGIEDLGSNVMDNPFSGASAAE